MKVAFVHSFYDSRNPSGENVVVRAQIRALRTAGHEVLLVAQHTDERSHRRAYPVQAAVTTATGVGPDPSAELAAFAPDVVHVHNLFPNFGTRWLSRWRGPVVATLHNFRPMCAAASLSRDGEVCTRCPDGDPWASVRYACYRDSRIATLPLAWRNRRGAPHDALVARSDALVVISPRARTVYQDAGVPGDRISVVANFVDPAPRVPPAATDRWLFVGRLSPEKGLVELLEAWPHPERLDVIGDGPSMAAAVGIAPPGVVFHGTLPHDEVRRRMPGYTGLLFPSVWFEAGPTQVYVEAMAAGVPALAIQGNGTSDDISAHHLGVVVAREPTEHDIAGGLDHIRRHRGELSVRCLASFADRFSEHEWLEEILGVYRRAIRTARS